jgi:hypothetical protein
VREITQAEADVASIAWTVHVANRKAALNPGADGDGASAPGVAPLSYGPAEARNKDVTGDARHKLAITPPPVTIDAAVDADGGGAALTGAIAFPGEIRAQVRLATICTEPGTGRLLFFGGDGVSNGVLHGAFSQAAPLDAFVNNNGWHDDTADGRVTACITFSGRRSVTLDRPEQAARVLSVLPRYVPGIGYFTSLNDVATDAVAVGATVGATGRQASFMADIYPILRSVSHLHWVNRFGAKGHGVGKADYLSPGATQQLADPDASPGSEAPARRTAIFARVRDPADLTRAAQLMPTLPPEVIKAPKNSEDLIYDVGAVTALQYAMLTKWRDGDFDNDHAPGDPFVPLDSIEIAQQPAALDLAAPQSSAGTPLFADIEAWQIMRDRQIYAAPLRLCAQMQPGDMTMGNALPWQADYFGCDETWWPVQRPTDVIHDGVVASWAPSGWSIGEDNNGCHEMVRNWWKLGLIVSPDGGATYHEQERDDGSPA